MSEITGKSPLILNTKGSDTRVFELKLKHQTGLMNKDFPNMLIFGKNGYPSNPIFYDKSGYWKEIFIEDLIGEDEDLNLKVMLSRLVVVSEIEKVLYNLYKLNTLRSSTSTKKFVRWVLSIVLNKGFDGDVISITKAGLSIYNIKSQAAKAALKKLHDLGIIIFMSGYGLPIGHPRVAIPMGVMLHPDWEEEILIKLSGLKSGKLDISDFKEL